MSTKGKRLIWIGPADGSNAKPLTVEGIAKAAHLPGTPLALAADSTGFEAAAQGDNLLLIANLDSHRSKSVDDAWTINENMVAVQPRSGEIFHVLVITGKALVRGTPLTVPLAGGPLDIGTEANAVCYADEIITTTATQLVRARKA